MASVDQILVDFQHSYRARDWNLGSVRWVGFVSNRAGQPVLLLHGPIGDAEAMFPLFNALATATRPIAPSLPDTIDTVDAALDGLISLLDRFVIERAHVFGHGIGGYLAQRLVRRTPGRVASLTLLNAGPPSPRHAPKLEEMLKAARREPEFLLRWRMRDRLASLARGDLASLPTEERRFWMSYLESGLRERGLNQRVESAALLQLDYHQGPPFSAHDLGSWPGNVRLIRFAKDASFDDTDSQALKCIYPRGEWTIIPDAGPLGLVRKSPQVAEAIVAAMQ